MKARIEKKLSKKLGEIAPKLFDGAWVDSCDPSDLAYEQGSRVSGVLSIGGELDYWGEGSDHATCLAWFVSGYHWLGNFKEYPEGHKFAHYPDTGNFKATSINLLKLADKIEIELTK